MALARSLREVQKATEFLLVWEPFLSVACWEKGEKGIHIIPWHGSFANHFLCTQPSSFCLSNFNLKHLECLILQWILVFSVFQVEISLPIPFPSPISLLVTMFHFPRVFRISGPLVVTSMYFTRLLQIYFYSLLPLVISLRLKRKRWTHLCLGCQMYPPPALFSVCLSP